MSCEDIIRLTLWTAQPKLSVIGILQGQYDVKGGFCETLKISLNLLISLNPPKKWTWIGLNFVFNLSPGNRVITEDPVNKTRPLTCLVLLELAPFHIWKYGASRFHEEPHSQGMIQPWIYWVHMAKSKPYVLKVFNRHPGLTLLPLWAWKAAHKISNRLKWPN